MKLKGIRRVNEYTDPELLGGDEVTILKNFILDGGVAKKRGAIQSYNTSTTLGGTIRQMFELDGSIIASVDVGASRSLKKLSGGVWGSIATSLADLRLAGVQRLGKLYLTNGSDAPFVTDGSAKWDLGLPTPDLGNTTTISSTTEGYLDESKVYRYAIAYINDEGTVGNFSVIGHRDDSLTSSTYSTDSTHKSIQFTGLPVSTRTDVTGRRIYRTEGDGATFYWLTDLDNIETAFTDTIADSNLQTDSLPYTNVPTKANHICLHKDRLFLGNTTSSVVNSVTKPPKVDMKISTDRAGSDIIYYAVSYVDSYGNESILSESDSVSLDNEANWTNTLSKIPKAFIGSARRDPNVVAIKIYRSSDNSTFYHIKTIDHTNADWFTSLPYLATTDASLVNGGQYSPVGSENYSSRVYFSDLSKFGKIDELNYIDVYPQDDQEIIGLVDQEDGVLVFKEKSICFIHTSGSPFNWRISKIADNIGCNDAKSIQRAKNSVYFRFNDDIYNFPQMEIVSLQFNDTLDGFTLNDTTYVSKYGWYVIVSDGELYIYDERNGSWLVFDATGAQFNSVIEMVDGTFYIGFTALLKYDPDETLDYDFDSGNTATIESTLRSKTFITGTPTQGFRIRRLYSNYRRGGDVTESLTDPQNGVSRSKSFSGAGWVDSKEILDSWSGEMHTASKIYYQLAGDISEFNGMEIEGILRHRRRTWS